MKKSPKVSIYIPSHNYGRFLGSAIESVLKQSFNDWEILIINDNSSDTTEEVMNLYAGDERIRLFTTDGIGLHGVCNLALREAKGEYIIRLDGDDWFDENILLVLSNFLDQHTEVALVFSDYYLTDEFGSILSHERREKIVEKNHMLDEPPNGACFLARKQVLLDVGGYRDDLRAQDGYLIWTRLLGKYKCANINLPLYFYRRHGENLTHKMDRILEARRRIKSETHLVNLDDFRPFIVTIPCRKNYDYSTDLWKKQVRGESLLSRAIRSSLDSKIFDYVVVACDNEEVQDEMSRFTDARLKFFKRDSRETIRSESVVNTLRKVSLVYDPQRSGTTLLNYMQTPFIRTNTLEEAIYTLVLNNADSSFAVEEVTRDVFKRSPFGLEQLNRTTGIHSDFNTVFVDACTALATRNKNLDGGSSRGSKSASFLLTTNESFTVDSEVSLHIANILESYRSVLVPTIEREVIQQADSGKGSHDITSNSSSTNGLIKASGQGSSFISK